ncbi:MAG: SAM hydrolase/SAM-dependent halogenase family protein, partial [Planctomycetota bacterium]
MSVVTLLTDFGTEDPYVAAMKGAILSHCSAQIVDLTHGVPAFDAETAGYLLEAAAFHFPAGAVHVAVVDPGVGTGRRLLAASCAGHSFLAPDNGLLDFLARRPGVSWHEVDPQLVARGTVSPTFHGRDLFAPAAAFLCVGLAAEELGPAVDPADLVRV